MRLVCVVDYLRAFGCLKTHTIETDLASLRSTGCRQQFRPQLVLVAMKTTLTELLAFFKGPNNESAAAPLPVHRLRTLEAGGIMIALCPNRGILRPRPPQRGSDLRVLPRKARYLRA